MLHNEFAISVDQVRDFRDLILLESRFGFHKGSMISAFPKNWLKNLDHELRKKVDDHQVDNITDNLKKFKTQCLIKSGRDYNSSKQWIDAVLESNQQKAFHRIVDKSKHQPPEFINSIELLSDDDFEVSPQVFRTESDLAGASSLLLSISEKITLLDPFFCLSKVGYQKTLASIIQLCKKKNVSINIFSEMDEKTKDWNTIQKPAIEEFVEKNLPQGFKFNWFSVSDKDTGYVHPRGLFTEHGGIVYDRGFEEPNPHGQKNVSADIHIMKKSAWLQKHKDYNAVQPSEHIEIVHQWSNK